MLFERNRLRILRLLSIRDLCVCELSGALRIPQSNLSNHLSVLKALDIVESERRNRWVYYSINPEKRSLIESLLKFFPLYKDDMERLRMCLSGSFGLGFCKEKRKLCPHRVLE